MKKYNFIQRVSNIITRAEEYGYTLDSANDLDTIIGEAEDILTDNIDYDRIEAIEMGNHYTHYFYTDDMGYTKEADGEFIGEASRNRWFKKMPDNSFRDIDWFEADYENDYVFVDKVIDSEGMVVMLVTK